MSIKTKPSREMLDEMQKQPQYWKGSVFYFNSNDYRVFLPKRAPFFGWTLNLANPFSYLFIIGLIAAIGLLPLLFAK